MKLKLFLTAVAAFLLSVPVFADTIVTAPIDSRPISCDYLEDLAALSGDTVVYPDKADMDLFSGNGTDDRFADSAKVRASIYALTGENNKKSTTVIINTSTYFTGGLVGSRVGSNYNDINTAMEDLRKLTADYTEPYYYVNLTTPRSLPETRFNDIWRNAEPIKGIGYYYLQYNPTCEDYDYIKANYSKVNPTQLLMEYSYVCGKKDEGVPLTRWEKDFYSNVNKSYMSKDPYRTYLNNYIKPFDKTVEIMSGLMELKKEGLIDEIVISTDDLQLPNSITYFNSKKAGWVQRSGGSAVKYSFARSHFETGTSSVMKQIDAYEGKKERYLSMTGRGKDINVIYGTDEVPQLIYARDLARKKESSAKFNIIYNRVSQDVASYDVSNIQKLTNAACDFVNGYKGYLDKETDLYIYAYSGKTEAKSTMLKMQKSLKEGNFVALVELYDSTTLNSSDNELFKRLIQGNLFKITDLTAYSAWNTNGNAIGLGVAHAQVFAINEAYTKNQPRLAKAQTEHHLRHVLEDGIYTVQTKRLLSNAGYKPNAEEKEESAKLREYLNREDVFSAFKNSTIKIRDKVYTVKEVKLEKCGFPWLRTFDCDLDVSCEIK